MKHRSGEMPRFEKKERKQKVLGKITVMRHGATEYGNQYPGISELGQEQMLQNAEILKNSRVSLSDNLTFIATPAVRTQGSLDIIKNELGKGHHKTHVYDKLRPIDVFDTEKFGALHKEHRGEGTMYDWEKNFTKATVFDEENEAFETRSQIADRAHGSLDTAIQAFYRYARNPKNTEIPHIICVSHFEVLNKFLCDVFKLDPSVDDLIHYGEVTEIDVLEPTVGKESEEALLHVRFRNMEQHVGFDRHNFTIQQLS